MTKTPAVKRLLAGFVLLVGSVSQTFAQTPAPAQMLDPKLAPKHDDVHCTVPTPEELKSCTVELVKGTAPGSSGWVLMDFKKNPDGTRQPLRRFFDSNGDGKVDIWSYYKDGAEVYRELDTTLKGAPNNFRWLNSGGMKWGVGGVDAKTGRGYITGWRMISAEEVGQEVFRAVADRDFERLQRLLITDAEMQALKLSQTSIKRIAGVQQSAPKNFEALCKRLDLKGSRIERVEGLPASCVLEDGPGGETVVIKYRNRPIQYEINKGTHWLHTGELIQVGLAWRLVGAPSDQDPLTDAPAVQAPLSPELQQLYDTLTELDKNPPTPKRVLDKDKQVEEYFRTRIGLVQRILPLDKADQRETWYKQLFDNLASRAQNSGDPTQVGMLTQLKKDVVEKMPTSDLAPYGIFRVMSTNYSLDMAAAKPQEIPKIQDAWLDQLAAFVKKYPRAEDAAQGLWELAINSEFSGKDEQAKGWYTRLSEDFPKNEHAPRARGSVARLNLPGTQMKLTAPMLYDQSKMFDIGQLKGKIVIVHYWASYGQNFAGEHFALAEMAKKHGIEIVSINLDDTAENAKKVLANVKSSATHLFQVAPNNLTGGLNSPLATQYGIHMLPTMFLIAADGRVTSRSLQIGDIETELKKIQK